MISKQLHGRFEAIVALELYLLIKLAQKSGDGMERTVHWTRVRSHNSDQSGGEHGSENLIGGNLQITCSKICIIDFRFQKLKNLFRRVW